MYEIQLILLIVQHFDEKRQYDKKISGYDFIADHWLWICKEYRCVILIRAPCNLSLGNVIDPDHQIDLYLDRIAF